MANPISSFSRHSARDRALIPWQNQWYCPDGIAAVPENKLILRDDSVALGDGSVAIMRTKGHTEGNHSIVSHVDTGLIVTSENGAEIIINGNTMEYVVDQYISMVQEKSVAGPNPKDERFPNVAPAVASPQLLRP